ncbi:MAG: hypothetical protein ACLGIP_20140 [Alphaproteobacteria bacterium]
MAAFYVDDGNPEGSIFGRSGGKIGFLGANPTAIATGFTAPAATAASSSTPFGYTTAAQADAIVAWIRAADAELKAKGLISA